MDGNTHQRVHRQEASVRIEALEGRQLLTAAVTGLTLINANTGRVIEALDYGDTIDLARTGARLSVRASTVGAESVRFNYDGEPEYGVDSSAPYSIGGGRGRGRRDQAWTPTVGTHTLVVTPYAEDGGAATPGESRLVLFNVIDSRGNRGRSYAPPTRGGMNVGRPGARPSAAPTVPGPLYVNAGGGTFTDSLGRVFRGDTGFMGGFTGSSTAADVANTLDDALYQSYRAGSRFAFSEPVANGNYSLWLHFVEPTATQAGERTFDVTAEGAVVLSGYDVFAEAGGANTATAEAIDVSVTDNRLDLSFAGVAGDAIVSGITLIPTDVPAEAKPWSWGCYADVVASVRSATHLRMLGQLVMLYANDNKGRYPANWASLAGDYLAHPYFANPRSDALLPRGELSGVEQRAWAERSAATLRGYIYTGAGIHSGSPETEVLGYENPNRVWGDVHVLFNDGHVERLSRTEAAALIGFPDVPPTDAPAARDPLDPTCLPDAAALQSARNLREIAKAMMMYANDFKGRYPNDLGTLFDVARMDVATFVNPRGDTEVPVGLSREDQIAWVNAATDYVYVGAGKGASMDSEVVLAYENPAEMKDGINILFNDGRVEFREMRWAVETLRRAGVTGVA